MVGDRCINWTRVLPLLLYAAIFGIKGQYRCSNISYSYKLRVVNVEEDFNRMSKSQHCEAEIHCLIDFSDHKFQFQKKVLGEGKI